MQHGTLALGDGGHDSVGTTCSGSAWWHVSRP
jgi:hypothetical protein